MKYSDTFLLFKKTHYFSPLAALNTILKREYKVTIKQSFYSELKKEDVDMGCKTTYELSPFI